MGAKCGYCCQKGAVAAVPSKKVEIVWFDHTYHTLRLPSCNRQCSDMFTYSTVSIFHIEGKAQIEQSYTNCFQNNRQRPPSLEL